MWRKIFCSLQSVNVNTSIERNQLNTVKEFALSDQLTKHLLQMTTPTLNNGMVSYSHSGSPFI